MADWTQAYARALGIKWTKDVAARLQNWQRFEGGHTANSAKNNYMNSKETMPGSWDAIGNGVQGYKTLAQGAMAFARTVKSKYYSPALTQWLATGQGDPSHDLAVWVAGPGGADSPSAQEYAAKVLGGHTSSSTVGKTTPASPSAPGDMFGQQVDPMTAVRSQAAAGFGQIATGQAKATDTLGPLLKTLHAASTQIGPVTVMHAPKGSPKSASQAVNLAKKYLGVQYQWGGESPQTGFDCSGLIQYVWKALGVNVPRTSEQQWAQGTPIDLSNLKPGDAVFTEMGANGPGHVGMYIGNGQVIAAPHTGTVVQVQNLSDWNVAGARRFA
jgi:cell wall-associated NlpC family hydrolase